MLDVKLDSFSDDFSYNFLQQALRIALYAKSTDILFYFGEQKIQWYHNIRVEPYTDTSGLLFPKDMEEFLEEIGRGTRKIYVPEGFFEEIPVPIELRAGLERKFTEIYCLNSMDDLSAFSSYRQIIVDGITVLTRLSRVPEGRDFSYRMRFLVQEDNK